MKLYNFGIFLMVIVALAVTVAGCGSDNPQNQVPPQSLAANGCPAGQVPVPNGANGTICQPSNTALPGGSSCIPGTNGQCLGYCPPCTTWNAQFQACQYQNTQTYQSYPQTQPTNCYTSYGYGYNYVPNSYYWVPTTYDNGVYYRWRWSF